MSENNKEKIAVENTVPFADLKRKPLELANKPWFKTPKDKKGLTCYHHSVLVDPNMAYVECAECGEHLNPMNVLSRLATEESRFASRRTELIETMKVFDSKSKTKCEHCHKFTNLRTR